MEFKCSNCNYTSGKRENTKRHISKKNKCSESNNVPHIIEVPVDIICDYCEKSYKSKTTLKRHLKTCKVKKTETDKVIADQERKIIELEAKLAAKPSITNNIINNIIQVNGYRNTDFSNIKDIIYSKALDKTLMSIPKMIEYTHFNPRLPENHNIYISNQKGKYAMVYDGNDWCIKDQKQTIDKLIDDQEYALDEWVNKVGDEHPKEMKKFQRYMNVKEKDGAEEAMKEEVRMLLYNKRNVVKSR